MLTPWHVAVLIPARNEEALLPRCLDSVLAAAARLPRTVTCDVVVAVDCSHDASYAIAERKLRHTGAVLRCDAGVVGVARARAAQVALERSLHPRSRLWLANTDADCAVPAYWLENQLELAEQGADAIAGIVDVDCFDDHDEEVPDRFRASYTLHADGTHPHVHGANLGVRADAYLRAGGWSPLCTAEDHDLWRRLAQAEANRVSCSRLRVVTSGRRVGRAPMGFADALAAHNTVAA